MVKVGLSYRFVSNKLFDDKISLDDVIKDLGYSANLAMNIKLGKKLVKFKYSDVQVFGKMPQGIRSLDYEVHFKGEKERDLTYAISYFIGLCGTPHFIRGRFDLAKKPLEKYGKVFKRKLDGYFVGRHVIDKE